MTEVFAPADAEDIVLLRQLCDVYATAIDRRDAQALWSAFDPDEGRLIGREEVTDQAGAERILTYRDRYAKTFHATSTAQFWTNGDRALGEVYCIAHHLMITDGRYDDYVMYIRYQDTYLRRRAESGQKQWRILERRLTIDWTQTIPASTA